jgi:hypothetical protein
LATVLHIQQAGYSHWDDPEVTIPVLDFRVVRTGEDEISGSITPTINIKVLGIYKTAVQLSADCVQAVKDYIESTYSITTFNKTYVMAEYSVL